MKDGLSVKRFLLLFLMTGFIVALAACQPATEESGDMAEPAVETEMMDETGGVSVDEDGDVGIEDNEVGGENEDNDMGDDDEGEEDSGDSDVGDGDTDEDADEDGDAASGDDDGDDEEEEDGEDEDE